MISNEAEYDAALARAYCLLHSPKDSLEFQELDALVSAIEAYEECM
jgi:antitoxin component HigA of HigAB toxin-antitoxin module